MKNYFIKTIKIVFVVCVAVVIFNRLAPFILNKSPVDQVSISPESEVNDRQQYIEIDEYSKKIHAFMEQLGEDGLLVVPVDLDITKISAEDSAYSVDVCLNNEAWLKDGHMFYEIASHYDQTYFLWYYPGLGGPPPVIALECNGYDAIVANNVGEFLQSVATGYNFINGRWIVFDEHPEGEMLGKLQTLVREKIGNLDIKPDVAAKNAEKNHPEIKQFVKKYNNNEE